MNDPLAPSPNSAATVASCCGPVSAAPTAEVHPAESSPCCGTREGADAAGACCDPQSRRAAVAARAGCC
ncbi:hypothetical protein [Streptomyces sp. NRRL F-4474]|uniref:hypothetical protein n=1 Tax=Streptomyces sp. NRRL F-4474 TaxID=1463851 RepID=UPI00055A0CE2|nr:hypothetical protein [Streptomyces sp. NRRL F-4474]